MHGIPYVNNYNELVIPIDADPKYHYWKEGKQSIQETLKEIGASDEIKLKYRSVYSD